MRNALQGGIFMKNRNVKKELKKLVKGLSLSQKEIIALWTNYSVQKENNAVPKELDYEQEANMELSKEPLQLAYDTVREANNFA